MSIDINRLLPSAAVQQPGATTAKKALQTAENRFSAVLAEKSNQLELKENCAQMATHLVQLSHLSLLHGLFSDSAAEDGSFSLLQMPDFFPGRVGVAGQTIDGYGSAAKATTPRSTPMAPADIDRLIERVAGHVSLASGLIRSVVTAESAYDPQAVSPAGARGLMQLMPETARELGVEDSFDPEQNLIGGSRYLRRLLDKYDGDLDHALAAYNWGPGNVDRHGLEKIPQETREYLSRVKNLLAKEAT